jgi:zinc protease
VALAGLAAAAGAAPAHAGGALHETTLENGLRLIVKEDFAKDLVALSLHVDGGNRTEPRELSGLSHYYEHLIFRGGTAKQKELETRKVFLGLGDFGGYTTADLTAYDFVVPRASFDEALRRFADAVLEIEVTAEKVAKEREVVLSEYKMSYADNPSGWAWYNLERTAFRVHPYGRTTIGLREVIEGADLPRLKSFHAERYVPNHMVVAVVGAIRAADALAAVRAAFGSRPRGKESFETGEVEPPQDAARTIVEARRTEKSYAMLGWKAAPVGAPEAYALRVLAQVLGGGAASRLEREVRARRGLALEASAWYDETRDPGLLGVALTLEPGREAEALAAVADEAARLRRDLVPEDELEAARCAIASGWTLANESYIQQARWITRFAIWGDPALGQDAVARVRAVTAAEVREAARRTFASKLATVSVVRPEAGPAVAEDALRAALARCDAGGAAAAAATARGRTLARTLACGVRAIAREDTSAPVVAVSLELASPLAYEPSEKPGVAALGERLLLRGAGARSREELAARIDALGIRLDTGLDRDSLTVTLAAPAGAAAEGIALLGDVAYRPRFDAAEVEKARAEQVAAIQAIDDRSFDLAAREFYAALYEPGSLYGRPVAGTVDGVRAAVREDLVHWHAALARPEHAVVAVVGAIDAERALALLDAALAPGGPATAEATSPAPAAPIATPRPAPADRLLARPREQVAFRLGFVGIAATDPDFVPLAIGIRHLSTELFFRYVYEKGIAYRCWTYLRAGRGPHPFTFEMGVSAPNYKAARAGLEEALRALVERGLGAEDLERAKREAIQRHLLGQQTALEQAGLLAFYESVGLGWQRVDALPEIYRRVTADDVNAAIKRRLDPARLTIAVVGDLAAAGIEERTPAAAGRKQ